MMIATGARVSLARQVDRIRPRDRFRGDCVCVLIATVCVACTTPAPPHAENISATTAAKADADVRDYQLQSLETDVQTMPDGVERDYFGGVLAARSGRFNDAISRLNRALPNLRKSAPKRAATALDTIATAYRAENQYGDAARAYADLSDHFGSELDEFPADDAALAGILSGTPPQTISWHGPITLKTLKNPIGSRVAELTVNGVRGPWILDTGANQSVVSRTFAERIGVTALPGVASGGSGTTGLQSSIRAAVLPRMQIGGATLTNVVLIIIDDQNLRIEMGSQAYQIDAILGYPVLKALGIITFTRDQFLAGEAAERNNPGTRMYMRGLDPAIQCDVEGRPLLFTLDTGASSTELSVRYYELFRQQAYSWKSHSVTGAGAGGSIQQTVYVQPHVVMQLGTSTVTLNDVSILPVRMHAGVDLLFGNLGRTSSTTSRASP
jgi:predicted aspartyl protease